MSAAIGTFSALGIGITSTVDQPLDFMAESMGVREQFLDTNGVRGTRDRAVERMRRGIRAVSGALQLEPTALEWTYLLPWILGGTATGTSYPMAETLPARYVTVDRVTKVPTYDGCKIDQATFSADQGGILQANLSVIGIDETIGNAGTFPSLVLDATVGDGPFVMTDSSGAVSVNSSTLSPAAISIGVNNFLDRNRFFNSLTLTSVNSLDKAVNVSFMFGYGDAQAVYNLGVAGVPVVVTFTNGTVSLKFSMGRVCFPREPFPVRGRNEIMMGLNGSAYASGNRVSITNVALTSNVATITTGTAHGLTAGDGVLVAAVTNNDINGCYIVASAPSTTTFTYAVTHANIGSGADTGTTRGTPLVCTLDSTV